MSIINLHGALFNTFWYQILFLILHYSKTEFCKQIIFNMVFTILEGKYIYFLIC